MSLAAVNPMVLPVLAVGLLLFTVGDRLHRGPRWVRFRWLWMSVAVLIALPGVLYATYYLHVLDDQAWFYALRARSFSELAASGMGLIAGIAGGPLRSLGRVRRPLYCSLLMPALICPYIKPLISPLPSDSFQNVWSDGVCRQSTAASCGPACIATVLAMEGVCMAEADVARASFTCQRGTEVWYLARVLRQHGLVGGISGLAAR